MLLDWCENQDYFYNYEFFHTPTDQQRSQLGIVNY